MDEQLTEAYLTVTIASEQKRFPLRYGDTCTIGRSDKNTIVLDDNQVSRKHAMVQCTEVGVYYLTDLRSRNGIQVNGSRVSAPVSLHPGDQIVIGSHQFEFHGQTAPVTTQTAFGETILNVARATITVLVTDILGFTELSRTLGEDRLSQTMGGWFRECGEVLKEQGASEQKYIGDAIMAFWIHRSDEPEPDEMYRVFLAVQRIFHIAARFDQRFDLDAPVRIGAGINTGAASIGNVGSSAVSDYTAMSDAVNMCFRLEAATRKIGCDVALGSRTQQALSAHVDTADLFEQRVIQLKGYEGPSTVYTGPLASVDSLLEILRTKLPARG